MFFTKSTWRKLMFRLRISLIVLIAMSSCAVHYYDDKTGAEHIFGFGHMVMKAMSSKDSHQAIVRGTDILGLGIGKNDDGAYFSLGYDSYRRIEVIDENSTINLEWPDGDFLNTRIGSSWPESAFRQNRPKEVTP